MKDFIATTSYSLGWSESSVHATELIAAHTTYLGLQLPELSSIEVVRLAIKIPTP
ncbi:predicted protein [Botrytis cinerea T4]|uniref:Uncharacterized protein n=1 Tax=Botryotinia fuckeliana (strain T4) TaxID=999810 RepID=G2Y008_BOTF4|nr:predicted protein [Botrytis cinerea T4]